MNALRTILMLSISVGMATTISAQSLTFNYQGHLTSGGSPANGNYDFEFALFTAISGGSQTAGSPLIVNGVTVANGLFTVALNFGNQFPGANRYLEVRVRLNGSLPEFTTLSPRQQISSSPYAITAANASNATNAVQLGGVAANQYVITTDPRMSDARQPVAGNSSYVQNRTTLQTATNFNISGVGNAGVFNAAVQFNLNGDRILGASGTSNTFGGVDAGANASNLAENNTFFGKSAGQSMVTAGGNSFFGSEAGQNTTVGGNSFFGSQSGKANTSGQNNSFFGLSAGTANTTGDDNSFFGRSAGSGTTTGNSNSFFGRSAGLSNTAGINGSFFGFEAGRASTGNNNSFFGYQAGLANTTGINNSSFGVLAGRDNISGSGNSFFGPRAGLLTRGDNNTFIGWQAGDTNFAGNSNTTVGANADVGSAALDFATAIGAGARVDSSNTVVLGRAADEVIAAGNFTAKKDLSIDLDLYAHRKIFLTNPTLGGDIPLCRNSFDDGSIEIARCVSSIRFKRDVGNYSPGLSLISRLRPVSFNWKRNGMADVGFVAEEVANVEPLLTTTDKNGEVEGVKYDRISVVLVNAIKEQQVQIEKLQKQVEALAAENRSFRSQIRGLRTKRTKKP